VTVLLVWGAAVVLALIVLGIVGYDLAGHLRRLVAALRAAEHDLAPRARQVVGALAGAATRSHGGTGAVHSAGSGPESTPGGPGRHRVNP
jgi:hypothetical protein